MLDFGMPWRERLREGRGGVEVRSKSKFALRFQLRRHYSVLNCNYLYSIFITLTVILFASIFKINAL